MLAEIFTLQVVLLFASVEQLGIADVRVLVERVGRHEPTHAGRVAAFTKVIEAGFAIVFFAGEFVRQKRMLG
jgi:hypothetical protein